MKTASATASASAAGNAGGVAGGNTSGGAFSVALDLSLLLFVFAIPFWADVMVFVHYSFGKYEPQVMSGSADIVAFAVGLMLHSRMTEMTLLIFPSALLAFWGAAYCIAELWWLIQPSFAALLSGNVSGYRSVIFNPLVADDLLAAHVAITAICAFYGLVVGAVGLYVSGLYMPSVFFPMSEAANFSAKSFKPTYAVMHPNSIWLKSWDLKPDDWPFRQRLEIFKRDWAWGWHPAACFAKLRTLAAATYFGALCTELTLEYLVDLKPNGMWFPEVANANLGLACVVGCLFLPITPLGKGSLTKYHRWWRQLFLFVWGLFSYVAATYAYARAEADIDTAAFAQNVLQQNGERCFANSGCFYRMCVGSVAPLPTTFFYEASTNTSYWLQGANCHSFADRSVDLWNVKLTFVVAGGVFLVAHAAYLWCTWRDSNKSQDVYVTAVENYKTTKKDTCGWLRASLGMKRKTS